MLQQSRDEVIAQALELARGRLGMDAAYVSAFVPGYQRFVEVTGDAASFGAAPGGLLPLDESVCALMVEDRVPNVIADVSAQPELAEMAVARDTVIGAYVGVPVAASDGTAFGSLCCISAEPDPALGDRDLEFMRVLGHLIGDRLRRQELERVERERLEAMVATRTAELELAQAETAMRLSRAVEYRDDATGDHIDRVGKMAERLARAAGQPEPWCRLIRLAAPLHDIGKVAAPDVVLLKPGSLTAEERQLIQAHAEVGHRMLADSSSQLLQMAASIARTHHERVDGQGYGRRLRCHEIPLEGRIVAIVDVFDALTHDRIYRAALPVPEALAVMRQDVGHFDADLLETFIARVVPALAFGWSAPS